MNRRFTIKPLYFDITTSMFWYHKFYFVIQKNIFLYQKINLWHHEIDIMSIYKKNKKKNSMSFWYHKIRFCYITKEIFDNRNSLWFLISPNRFFDIKKIELMMSKIEFFISEYHGDTLIHVPQTGFFDITKSSFCYHKIDVCSDITNTILSFLWYQKNIFLWYHKNHFVMSKSWYCDITK